MSIDLGPVVAICCARPEVPRDMWKVKTKGDKVVVRHPAEPTSLVIKIRREIELVPRSRIVVSLGLSSFLSGISFAHDGLVAGLIMGVLAVFLMWAASR